MLTPSILVIDDVADIVTEMVIMFALVGLPAVGADSIEGALHQLRQDEAIRVILCDLHLRCEDGLALPARLRADPALAGRRFDIMFMTGEGGSDRLVATMPAALPCATSPAGTSAMAPAAPSVTILRKPIDPDRLIRQVQNSLEVMQR